MGGEGPFAVLSIRLLLLIDTPCIIVTLKNESVFIIHGSPLPHVLVAEKPHAWYYLPNFRIHYSVLLCADSYIYDRLRAVVINELVQPLYFFLL